MKDSDFIYYTYTKKYAFLPVLCKNDILIWLTDYYIKSRVMDFRTSHGPAYIFETALYKLSAEDCIIEKLIEDPTENL